MAHGKDSLGRWWNVERGENDLIVITPIGHNGDPDTDLSPEDDDMLMRLAPDLSGDEEDSVPFCAEDLAYERADRARALNIDALLGML